MYGLSPAARELRITHLCGASRQAARGAGCAAPCPPWLPSDAQYNVRLGGERQQGYAKAQHRATPKTHRLPQPHAKTRSHMPMSSTCPQASVQGAPSRCSRPHASRCRGRFPGASLRATTACKVPVRTQAGSVLSSSLSPSNFTGLSSPRAPAARPIAQPLARARSLAT